MFNCIYLWRTLNVRPCHRTLIPRGFGVDMLMTQWSLSRDVKLRIYQPPQHSPSRYQVHHKAGVKWSTPHVWCPGNSRDRWYAKLSGSIASQLIPANTWISPPTIRCSTNWVWYELSSIELLPLLPRRKGTWKNLITSIDPWQCVATASGQWILPIAGLRKPFGSAVIMTPHTKFKAVLLSPIWLVLVRVFDVCLYPTA